MSNTYPKNNQFARLREFALVATLIVFALVFYSPLLQKANIYVFRDMLDLLLPVDHAVRTLRHNTNFPLWNPFQVLGKPLVPELLSGLLYPPSYLFAWIPEPFGFNLSIVMHHFWAAVGMYLLLRNHRYSFSAAGLGALLLSYGGFYVSMDNMLNALQSASWLPWTILFFEKCMSSNAKAGFAQVVFAQTMMILGGMPEFLIFAELLLLAEISFSLFGWNHLSVWNKFKLLIRSNLATIALASIFLLPFLEYLSLSSRAGGLGIDQVTRFSMHPANILGFFYPQRLFDGQGLFTSPHSVTAGWYEEVPWVISKYLGPSLLLALPFLITLPRKLLLLGLGILFFSVLLACGSYIPGYSALLEQISILRLVRYPEKFLLISHFLLVAASSAGFHFIQRRFQLGSLVGAAFILLIAADLYRVNGNLMPIVSWRDLMSPAPTVGLIMHGDDLTRIYSNHYSDQAITSDMDSLSEKKSLLDQGVANLYGISNLNAAASINLEEHEELMSLISQLPKNRVAPFFGTFGVSYVTSQTRLVDYPGLDEVRAPASIHDAFLYKVSNALPRAFVPSRVKVVDTYEDVKNYFQNEILEPNTAVLMGGEFKAMLPDQIDGIVKVESYEANNVVLLASMKSEGVVVLSDSYYPGWKVTIDGKPAQLFRANFFARGVEVSKGEHTIVFSFMPLSFLIGSGISILAVLLVVGRKWLWDGMKTISSGAE